MLQDPDSVIRCSNRAEKLGKFARMDSDDYADRTELCRLWAKKSDSVELSALWGRLAKDWQTIALLQKANKQFQKSLVGQSPDAVTPELTGLIAMGYWHATMGQCEMTRVRARTEDYRFRAEELRSIAALFGHRESAEVLLHPDPVKRYSSRAELLRSVAKTAKHENIREDLEKWAEEYDRMVVVAEAW